MKHAGMSLIVKTTASLISGFVVVFAVYIALTGHLGPGGGFAGGVVLASAAVLLILAFGCAATKKFVSDSKCHLADSAGAMMFLVIVELIPDALETHRPVEIAWAFMLGFCLMVMV